MTDPSPPGSPARGLARGAALAAVAFIATLILLFGLVSPRRADRWTAAQPWRRRRRPSRPRPRHRRRRRPPRRGPAGRHRVPRRLAPPPAATASSPAVIPDPTLVGAGDIAACGLDDDSATAKLIDAIPGAGLHRRRQRLPGRHRGAVPRLLPTDLGPLPRPDATGGRQPRLADQGSRRLPRLFRRGGRARRQELVLVRPRDVARHRPRLRLRLGRRLRGGLGPGPLAQRRPGGIPCPVHARDLAPSPVQLRGARQRRRGRAVLAGPLRRGRGCRHQRPRPRLRAVRPAGPERPSGPRARYPRIRRRDRRRRPAHLPDDRGQQRAPDGGGARRHPARPPSVVVRVVVHPDDRRAHRLGSGPCH